MRLWYEPVTPAFSELGATRVHVDWTECEHGIIKDPALPCEHRVEVLQ